MKKPRKPKKPKKPEMERGRPSPPHRPLKMIPQDFVIEVGDSVLAAKSEFTFEDIRALFPSDISPSNIKFRIAYIDNGCMQPETEKLEAFYVGESPNPYFAKGQEYYKDGMERYRLELKEYKKEKVKHEEEMAKYEKKKEKYDEKYLLYEQESLKLQLDAVNKKLEKK